MRYKLSFFILFLSASSWAQETAENSAVLNRILERLDHLEQQNRDLIQEVTSLRQELAAGQGGVQTGTAAAGDQPDPSSVNERLAVNEARTAEQAQTKVEAAQKFPIQLNGLILFNAFTNGTSNNSLAINATNLLPEPYESGATPRQTILGFDFQGPQLPGNGRVNGTLSMDFWGGSSPPGSNWVRLRTTNLSFDWANRSFSVGQEKPLISPYEPDSLAEVGVSPLAGAGNLWYWIPQARYEERVHLSSKSGIKGQVAVLQTGGNAYRQPSQYYYTTPDPAKPALEGRLAFWHNFDDTRRFEFAPGFHVSSINIAGQSVGSRIGSFDWLVVPWSRLKISGSAFTGRNIADLGSLGNGIATSPTGAARAVRSSGGWSQVSVPITSHLTWNIFSGLENDKSTNIAAYDIVHNWSYASNLLYHLGPNVVVGLEGLQLRTRSASGVTGVQNHYDLAFGYLF